MSKDSVREEVDKDCWEIKMCHTWEVKMVGAARIRPLQGAATAGYWVEETSQALENVGTEKAEFLFSGGRARLSNRLHVSGFFL